MRHALREFPEGLAASRGTEYLLKRDFLRSALSRLGLEPVICANESSVTLTTAYLPAGWSYERWFEANYSLGYVLYGCKGVLRDKCFQVSNMGDLSMEDLENWVSDATQILRTS
jgi:aspartate aminotransferase-like enzyme